VATPGKGRGVTPGLTPSTERTGVRGWSCGAAGGYAGKLLGGWANVEEVEEAADVAEGGGTTRSLTLHGCWAMTLRASPPPRECLPCGGCGGGPMAPGIFLVSKVDDGCCGVMKDPRARLAGVRSWRAGTMSFSSSSSSKLCSSSCSCPSSCISSFSS
jgi:hypothetical protein